MSETRTESHVHEEVSGGRIDTRVYIVFSFWDRVRMLFGAPARLYVTTVTEREPGRVDSVSYVEVGDVDAARGATLTCDAE